MKTIRPGVRVLTVLGYGIIIDFEHCVVNAKPVKTENYVDGDRIRVKLDNPKNWVCHSEKSGLPYFLLSDLLDWNV